MELFRQAIKQMYFSLLHFLSSGDNKGLTPLTIQDNVWVLFLLLLNQNQTYLRCTDTKRKF